MESIRIICSANAADSSRGRLQLVYIAPGRLSRMPKICPLIAPSHSTQRDERNAPQLIENNQKWYTPLDTLNGTIKTVPQTFRKALRFVKSVLSGFNWDFTHAFIFPPYTVNVGGVGQRLMRGQNI